MAKPLTAMLAAMALILVISDARADQTIVFLRHGEKPALGLGQLNCQGLNRALALPQVLQAKFGTPTAIYAPDPGSMAKDKGIEYNYVRPLATIEPTAIRLGMPVNTSFGLRQIQQLEQDLLKPANSSATIYVAWEHTLAQLVVQQLVATVGGNAKQIPHWADDDFDSLYVIHLKWENGKPLSVSFKKEEEGLNHQSVECPSTHL
jgi:hypothetical protein